MPTADMHEEGTRYPWRLRLRALAIRFLGWLLSFFTILVVVLYPTSAVRADGDHHQLMSWCLCVLRGNCPGWRYYFAGLGKIYAYGTPTGQPAHVVIMQSGRFVTQFPPSGGSAYVVNHVYDDAVAAGYSRVQAIQMARGATTLSAAMQLGRTAQAVGGALAGASGVNMLFMMPQTLVDPACWRFDQRGRQVNVCLDPAARQ